MNLLLSLAVLALALGACLGCLPADGNDRGRQTVQAVTFPNDQTERKVIPWTGRRRLTCPHKKFQEKHECIGCNNAETALAKSIHRDSVYPAGKNTVLYGSPNDYYAYKHHTKKNYRGQPEILCRNTHSIQAWECFTRGNSKRCKLLSRKHFFDHSAESGHLFYGEGVASFEPIPEMKDQSYKNVGRNRGNA